MKNDTGTGAVMVDTKHQSFPQQMGVINSGPEVLERPTP